MIPRGTVLYHNFRRLPQHRPNLASILEMLNPFSLFDVLRYWPEKKHMSKIPPGCDSLLKHMGTTGRYQGSGLEPKE